MVCITCFNVIIKTFSYVVVSNILESESLHQVHFTFPHYNVTPVIVIFKQLSQGNVPAVQKMSKRSKERERANKERSYPRHRCHTTQFTASKESHGRLKIPETPAC
ncbi:hypothetical protein TNCV_3151991 [Trichonephila clavipes]|nr:hypothetical protein TNCV_3151991 [Trichonephila clavipes]